MIICAAIQITLQEVPSGLFNKAVIPCLRHSNGYSVLCALRPDDKLHLTAVEGFIDHEGKFLDREEALAHALSCGQLSAEVRRMKRDRGEKMLFSEDLY